MMSKLEGFWVIQYRLPLLRVEFYGSCNGIRSWPYSCLHFSKDRCECTLMGSKVFFTLHQMTPAKFLYIQAGMNSVSSSLEHLKLWSQFRSWYQDLQVLAIWLALINLLWVDFRRWLGTLQILPEDFYFLEAGFTCFCSVYSWVHFSAVHMPSSCVLLDMFFLIQGW